MKMVSLCSLIGNISFIDYINSITKKNYSKSLFKRYYAKKEFSRILQAKEEISFPVDFINHGVINPEFVGNAPEIIFEDEIFIVVNKPPFLHCHPLTYSEQDNLLSFLRQKNSRVLNVNLDSYDRGLLYRIDYPTSGVVILCKDQNIFNKMRVDFSEIMKNKIYLAIVKGDFKSSGDFHFSYKDYGKKGHQVRIAEKSEENSRKGSLSIHKIQYDKNHDVSLVKVFLKTGLRHQIRTTLSHLGYPILGDELYGGEKAKRLYLHAYQYEFSLEGLAECFFAYKTWGFEEFFSIREP